MILIFGFAVVMFIFGVKKEITIGTVATIMICIIIMVILASIMSMML